MGYSYLFSLLLSSGAHFGFIFFGCYFCVAQSPPRLLPEATERVVPEGSTVQLPCPVEADPDTLFFEWFRDREPLDALGDARFRVQSNGGLRIRSAIPEDTGLYLCRAVNGFGGADFNVTLIVLNSPTNIRSKNSEDNEDYDETREPEVMGKTENIPSGFDNVEDEINDGKPRLTQVSKFRGSVIQKTVGSSLSLRCAARADPKPQVAWLKNGRPLPDSNLPGPSGRSRWTLHLHNLQVSDTGNYTCHVYNALGTVQATFAVKVMDRIRTRPEFVNGFPRNTSTRKGESAALRCRVSSDVQPNVQWLKQIPEATAIEVNEQQRSVKLLGEYFMILRASEVRELPDGSFESILAFPTTRSRDAGKYICLVANSMGFGFHSAFLTVHTGTSSEGQDDVPRKHFENTWLPFPLAAAAIVSGAIVTAGLLGLIFYCRARRRPPPPPPSSRATTSTASGGTPATDPRRAYVGLSCQTSAESQGPARLYLPPGPLPRTVPLHSIFL